MFVNKTRFRKLVKEAFNSGYGLIVGKVYGGLVVCGGTWTTWTEEGYVPNWVKAAVMEHTGELPKEGHVFRAKKDEPIQYEIADNRYFDLPGTFMRAKNPFTVTPMVYDNKWKHFRFLQNDATKEIIAVQSYLYELLDMKELGEENRPVGPSAETRSGGVLIWKNEHSAVAICKLDISGDSLDVMELLAEYEFKKEDF